MRPEQRPLASLLLLASPVWGLVLFFWLLALIPGGGNMPGETIIALGVLAPFGGAVPIFRSEADPITKTNLFVCYYALCAVSMFIAGWIALAAFK